MNDIQGNMPKILGNAASSQGSSTLTVDCTWRIDSWPLSADRYCCVLPWCRNGAEPLLQGSIQLFQLLSEMGPDRSSSCSPRCEALSQWPHALTRLSSSSQAIPKEILSLCALGLARGEQHVLQGPGCAQQPQLCSLPAETPRYFSPPTSLRASCSRQVLMLSQSHREWIISNIAHGVVYSLKREWTACQYPWQGLMKELAFARKPGCPPTEICWMVWLWKAM